MNDPTMLAFVGVLTTVLVQIIKKAAGTSEYGSLGLVAIVSLLGAWSYVAARDANFWPTLLEILKWAGSIYAYIILRFEGTSEVRELLSSANKYTQPKS